jgi:hypothetical protein
MRRKTGKDAGVSWTSRALAGLMGDGGGKRTRIMLGKVIEPMEEGGTSSRLEEERERVRYMEIDMKIGKNNSIQGK